MNFSVIVPFFNNSSNLKNLEETLSDYKNDDCVELIIINDCSHSAEIDYLMSYFTDYKNLKIINNEKNSGPSFSRMQGIYMAKGEYIFFLDADDGWAKNKAYQQYNYNKKNGIVISGGGVKSVTEENFKSNRKDYFLDELKVKEIGFNDALFFNPFATTSVGVLREKIIENPFDQTMRYAEDVDCWRRILIENKGCFYIDAGAFQFKNSYLDDRNSLSFNLVKMVKGNLFSLKKISKRKDISIFQYFLIHLSMVFSIIKLIYRVMKKKVKES